MLQQRYPKNKAAQPTSAPVLPSDLSQTWQDNAFHPIAPGYEHAQHPQGGNEVCSNEAFQEAAQPSAMWSSVVPQQWAVQPQEATGAPYQTVEYQQGLQQQYCATGHVYPPEGSDAPVVQQGWAACSWGEGHERGQWTGPPLIQQQQPWVSTAQMWGNVGAPWNAATPQWPCYAEQPEQCFQSEQHYQPPTPEACPNGCVLLEQSCSSLDALNASHKLAADVSVVSSDTVDSSNESAAFTNPAVTESSEGDSTVAMFFDESGSVPVVPVTSESSLASGDHPDVLSSASGKSKEQVLSPDSTMDLGEATAPKEERASDWADTFRPTPAYSATIPEEPVNQEVPEPVPVNVTTQGASSSAVNQETMNNERSQPSVARKAVIKPRQDGPFRPPPARHGSDSALVQHGLGTQVKQPPLLPLDGSHNMETQPDNLEQPPDTEEALGHKHASRHSKHRGALLGSLAECELDDPSSLGGATLTLLDAPEMPALVTLAPAAPPLCSRPSSRASSGSKAGESAAVAVSRAPVEGGAAPPAAERVQPQGERGGSLPMTRQSPLGGEEGGSQGRHLMQDLSTLLSEAQEHLVHPVLAGSSSSTADTELLQRTEPSGSTDCAPQDSLPTKEERPGRDIAAVVCPEVSSPTSARLSPHRSAKSELSQLARPHSRDLKDRSDTAAGREQNQNSKGRSDRREDRSEEWRYEETRKDDHRGDDRRDRRDDWQEERRIDRKEEDRRGSHRDDWKEDRRGDYKEDWRYNSKEDYRKRNHRDDAWEPEDRDYRDGWRSGRREDWRDDHSESWRHERKEKWDDRRRRGYDQREEHHWDDRRLPEKGVSRHQEYDYSYPERVRSRPSSRTSLNEAHLEGSGMRDPYYPQHSLRDEERTPSRHSESNESSPEGRRAHWSRQGRHGVRDDDPDSYYHQQRHKGKYGGNEGYDYDTYGRDYYNYYYGYTPRSGYGYGYYDELYRKNPALRQQLEERYREYYARLGYDTAYFDRLSVHSGRSSVNDESHKDSSFADDDAVPYSAYDTTAHDSYAESTRLGDSSHLPQPEEVKKFSRPHPLARFLGSRALLKLVPSSTANLPPLLEIHDIKHLFRKDPQFKELKQFPGPLVRSHTHKNDVIQFCAQKIQSFKSDPDLPDRSSHILLWELLILLLRQNGFVSGTDISELLLRDHDILATGAGSCLAPPPTTPPVVPLVEDESSPSPDEGIVVQDRSVVGCSGSRALAKFREFLLFGHKKDALDWAMQQGLWGHALSLAAKMDTRTYANIMTHFTNSLAVNDPLQTLYQHLSGRQPTAVTCVADEKWGDWRPHLAMILSNPSPRAQVDARSITTLGDVLATRGCLSAAHFCYLMAQVEFGSYSCKSSKLVLLGSSHLLPFKEFASNEAIQCTEIYEYSQSLANPVYVLPHLQMYKYIHATRLADYGFTQEALHYCEVIAEAVGKSPSSYPVTLVSQVYELACRLKYQDPHFSQGQGELEELGDPPWLTSFAAVLNSCKEGQVKLPQGGYSYTEQPDSGASGDGTQQAVPYGHQDSAAISASYDQSYQSYGVTSNVQPDYQSYQGLQNTSYDESQGMIHKQAEAHYGASQGLYEPQQVTSSGGGSWNAAPQATAQPKTEFSYGTAPTAEGLMVNGTSNFSEQGSPPIATSSASFDYYKASMHLESQRQQQSSRERLSSISSTADTRETRDSRRDSVDSSVLSSRPRTASGPRQVHPSQPSEKQPDDDTKDTHKSQGSGKGWLGGIFGKLLPKGPNQMILPDDKDPHIVWDDQKKCWVDKTASSSEVENKVVAPPTDSALTGKAPPDVKPGQNRFQMNRQRAFRKNYVDILNPDGGGRPAPTGGPHLAVDPSLAPSTSPPQFFIPQPSGHDSHQQESYDFVTAPTVGPMQDGNPLPPADRSAHSAQPAPKAVSSPMMFDPVEFAARSDSTPLHKSGGNLARRKAYPT